MNTPQIEEKESTELAVSASFSLQISLDNLKEMADQRALFERFVKVQLKDTIDFGILPGTEKPSLWKPGAEKIANIFQLGSRIISDKKEINIKENYAILSYLIEIFHIPSGKAVSQCEAICSSLEKKYKERKKYEWVAGKKIDKGTEPTPVGDVLNTLAKMAQKRAYVGAVIIATKASDFFNHDISEDEEEYYEQNPGGPKAHVYTPSAPAKPVPSEKSMAGEYADFKETPKVVINTKRNALAMEINKLRSALAWSRADLTKFVFDNTGKQTNQLDESEMQLLIEALNRVGSKS